MSRWGVLALVTMAYALGALAALAVAPLAPILLEALHLSRARVGLLLPAVYLGGVLMSLPSGWLTDHLGVRRTLGTGLAVMGVVVALGSLAPGLPALLGLLVIAGFGFSVLNPSTGRAVVEWFPPRERGVAMGIKQTGLTLGGITAAMALPPVALAGGWRVALVVAGGAAVASGLLVLLGYRAPATQETAPSRSRPRLSEIGAHLGRRGVQVVFGCGLVLSMGQASVLGYLALYARDTFGMSSVGAAQLLALAQVGGTASRIVWGVVSDRFFGGRRRPGVVTSAAVAAGTYVLFALGPAVPGALAYPLALLAGAAAFGWVGLYFALVAEIGGPRHAGLLTGVSVIFAWSGVLVGPPLFGVLLEATDGYVVPWLTLAALSLTAGLVLRSLPPLVQRGSV